MRHVPLIPVGAERRVVVLHNADHRGLEPAGDEDAEPPPRALAAVEADAEVVETAGAVSRALAETGWDPIIVPVGSDLGVVPTALRELGAGLVFNLVESLGGDPVREPELPRLLDAMGVRYTGNGPGALRLANAKDATRRLLELHHIPVPGGYVVVEPAEDLDPLEVGLDYPLFVKPAREDASIGVDQGSVVHDRDALRRRLARLASALSGPFLVERYLPGPELNVAIFPDPYAGQLVATRIEFAGYPPGYAPIVTYDCKWCPDSPESGAHSVPADLPEPLAWEVLRVARAAFLAVGGTSYGRVDLRLDAAGRPHVIDVNPNADLHPEAGLAVAAATAGIDYPSLVAQVAAGARTKARHVPAPSAAARPRAVSISAAAY